MKKFTAYVTRLCLLMLLYPALSVAADIQDHPGYVDLSDLSEILGVEPAVQVSLNTPLLEMLSELAEIKDPAAADLLAAIEWVNVSVFLDDQINQNTVSRYIEDIAEELDANYWDRVVRVRENDAHVDIFLLLSEDSTRVYGITVLVSEEEEAVLVNIVGDVSIDAISALGEHFDIDELMDIDFNHNG